jgi:hypothetical protein
MTSQDEALWHRSCCQELTGRAARAARLVIVMAHPTTEVHMLRGLFKMFLVKKAFEYFMGRRSRVRGYR